MHCFYLAMLGYATLLNMLCHDCLIWSHNGYTYFAFKLKFYLLSKMERLNTLSMLVVMSLTVLMLQLNNIGYFEQQTKA